jgi:hypothetical protein
MLAKNQEEKINKKRPESRKPYGRGFIFLNFKKR